MYKLIKHVFSGDIVGVIRLSDEANIPIAPDNRDYQDYLKWLEEGNQPLPADEGNSPA